jgi:hypothetical protein
MFPLKKFRQNTPLVDEFCFDLDQIHLDDKDALNPFICPINLGVFNDPITAVCCGNTLCKNCFIRSYESTGCCPLCRKTKIDMKQVIVILSLKNFINSKRIRCSQSSLGCDWVGKIDNCKNHEVIDCDYSTQNCTHCKLLFRKIDMTKHILSCPEKPTKCSFCEKVCLLKVLQVKTDLFFLESF